MTVHLEANPGDYAETILLPGDPLRAQAVAERLTGASCVNRVRGMLGFTGRWQQTAVSVQGTGMGMPSASIYAEELITVYGAKRLIRVGTAGAIAPDLRLGDVVLALAASTDSSMNRRRLGAIDYAPCASFTLLRTAVEAAESLGLDVRVGGVFSSDAFYDETEAWRLLAGYGTLVAEMETAALYSVAARHDAEALAILTVSDRLATGEALSAPARERTCTAMVDLALAVAVRACPTTGSAA